MKERIILGIAALALITLGAFAAYIAITPRLAPDALQAALPNAQQTTADPTTGIHVNGEGRVRAKPDIATLNVGVEVTLPALADASSQANSKMTAIIAQLKSMGIADKDMQTTNYNVSPQTRPPREGAPPAITGYRVSNQLRVTVRKIDDVGKILDAAVSAGANNVYGVSFGVDDMKPFREQARAAAMKDAQDKAGQLAKNANVQLGKVISISEGVRLSPQPLFRGAEGFAAASIEVPVQTGEMEIIVTLDVRYGIP